MVDGARRYGLPGPARHWAAMRAEIRADVLANGFDTARDTFVQAYGGTALDASLLLIPRVGFLPYDDPRVLGTLAAVERDLVIDGLVFRYRTSAVDDGRPPVKGCSWPAPSGSSTRGSAWPSDFVRLAPREVRRRASRARYGGVNPSAR